MTIVAHTHPFVIGVDTRARDHALSILAMPHGEVIDDAELPTTSAGMARALDWVGRRTGGDLEALWVIECSASCGAPLARMVTTAGYQVVEAARMSAKANHGIGKSDPLDVRRIAASVLPLRADQQRYLRKDNGVRAALRILLAARDHMTSERTATVNALIALLSVLDLGKDARRPPISGQLNEVGKWRSHTEAIEMVLARRGGSARQACPGRRSGARRERQDEHVAAQVEAGPRPARQAWDWPSDRDRCHGGVVARRTHALGGSFATLAGVCPMPAPSGTTVRHRLNCGGDRRPNEALHVAVIVRMTHDPLTEAHVDRDDRYPGHRRRRVATAIDRHGADRARSLAWCHTGVGALGVAEGHSEGHAGCPCCAMGEAQVLESASLGHGRIVLGWLLIAAGLGPVAVPGEDVLTVFAFVVGALGVCRAIGARRRFCPASNECARSPWQPSARCLPSRWEPGACQTTGNQHRDGCDVGHHPVHRISGRLGQLDG